MVKVSEVRSSIVWIVRVACQLRIRILFSLKFGKNEELILTSEILGEENWSDLQNDFGHPGMTHIILYN